MPVNAVSVFVAFLFPCQLMLSMFSLVFLFTSQLVNTVSVFVGLFLPLPVNAVSVSVVFFYPRKLMLSVFSLPFSSHAS